MKKYGDINYSCRDNSYTFVEDVYHEGDFIGVAKGTTYLNGDYDWTNYGTTIEVEDSMSEDMCFLSNDGVQWTPYSMVK